jgi:hypothetical protein
MDVRFPAISHGRPPPMTENNSRASVTVVANAR